jgi:hypothetical protein
MELSSIGLAEMSFTDAYEAKKALAAALDAMAYYGSDREHLETVAILHAAMVVAAAEAYRASEPRPKAPGNE